jgi:hypothetical protein
MREWHRLFFVNERRLHNFIAAGAIDADSPAIRLVGMPKADCLVDGTFQRADELASLGLDPSRPTVLYAPTWSPASSLNAMGEALVGGLLKLPVNVIVKLHDRSRDLRARYSGGVDWAARLQPLLPPGRAALAPGHDISPYLVASDLMVTDHSSAGIRVPAPRPPDRPDPSSAADRAREHPRRLREPARVGLRLGGRRGGAIAAVERGLADPDARSAERQRVAADLFYRPGGATARAVAALYDAIELDPAPVPVAKEAAACQP